MTDRPAWVNALEYARGNLRHLFRQMVKGGPMTAPVSAARGLLGPAIADLEKLEGIIEEEVARERAAREAAEADNKRWQRSFAGHVYVKNEEYVDLRKRVEAAEALLVARGHVLEPEPITIYPVCEHCGGSGGDCCS